MESDDEECIIELVDYEKRRDNMEKKIRDYVRHLDKIDMEVLTDEEVRAEQRKLKFQINLYHHELLRILGFFATFFISSVILLKMLLTNTSIQCIIIFVAALVLTGLAGKRYWDKNQVLNQLIDMADKIFER